MPLLAATRCYTPLRAPLKHGRRTPAPRAGGRAGGPHSPSYAVSMPLHRGPHSPSGSRRPHASFPLAAFALPQTPRRGLPQVNKALCKVHGIGSKRADELRRRGIHSVDDAIKAGVLNAQQRLGAKHWRDLDERIPRAEVRGAVAGCVRRVARCAWRAVWRIACLVGRAALVVELAVEPHVRRGTRVNHAAHSAHFK